MRTIETRPLAYARGSVLLFALPLLSEDLAHFHHVHLNATNPRAAIDFYTSKFDCEKQRFGQHDAVFAQKSWLLLNKVDKPPPHEITSAIWHMGWGAEDMKKEYDRQLSIKTPFHTPMTELFPNFFFAYVDGPDHALIELNTARHHNFGHVHLISTDAVSAGEWYVKHFGALYASGRPPTREPRFIRGFQIGPNASLMMDNVNIIIFPIEYARQQWPEIWKQKNEFDSPKGRVIDHVAFSVDDLAATLKRLSDDGVKIVSKPAKIEGRDVTSAFIEGPDRILIELVQGHTYSAWGSTHAGKPIPEFIHGEECLFCHRNDVGSAWQKNPHNLTTRQIEGSEELLLGRTHTRKLRKTGYNKLSLLDSQTDFTARCAGCHTTALDPKEKTYAYIGLDCYTCHGSVDLNHSGNTSLILLSKKRRHETHSVNSICASCHLRGGLSRSIGLPYPNNFVPGDNLFLDYQAKLTLADDPMLNPGDRHVYRSVRDVALGGADTTCLSCHTVHTRSTEKHRRVLNSAICRDCHLEGKPRKQVIRYEVHSPTCEY